MAFTFVPAAFVNAAIGPVAAWLCSTLAIRQPPQPDAVWAIM